MKKTFKKIRHKQHLPLDACREKLFFCPSRSGFTIVEVVAVLLIIGIIAAVAISRYTKTDTADLAAANTLKTHLRYAHLRAMGDTVSWGLEINSTSYTLQKNGATAPVNLPGENSATKNLEKTSINLDEETEKTVTFSSGRGIPIDSDGNRTNETFNIGSETITITEFTGFIP